MARVKSQIGNFGVGEAKKLTIEFEELPRDEEKPVYTVSELYTLARPILEQFPCKAAYILKEYTWYLSSEGLLNLYLDTDFENLWYFSELEDVLDEATNTPVWVDFACKEIGEDNRDYIVLYTRDE